MKKTWLALILSAALSSSAAFAQSKKDQPKSDNKTSAASASDYSQEPYIVEQYRMSYRYENDGTGSREQYMKIKLQSEAGVEQLGQIVFGYNSNNERVEIGYVRVLKPDGSVVNAPADSGQDLTAPVAREAPMYTDFRQKHITVPGLRPGDTLEYKITSVVHTALAPGQFWVEHDFTRDPGPIVLDEQLDVNIPKTRTIKMKTQPGLDAKVNDDGDRRVYHWASSHKVREDQDDDSTSRKKKKRRDPDEQPSVQLTTFSSWEEVGHWYAGLEKDRRAPAPEIRAKAEELTKNSKTDLEKIQAIYDYVAKNFRYVSLSFGLGRYQPHSASEVMANQYGDCKDKHTLMASLLEAEGLHPWSVLINSSRKIDPDIPSPSQFDHVITLVPLGKEQIWLDSTTEVAPFRLLSYGIRNKQALGVPQDAPARLVETPADPPMDNYETVDVDASVSDIGKLAGHFKLVTRGDEELILRLTFRRVPAMYWKQVAQSMVAVAGMAGAEITDLKAGDPADTTHPYEFEFNFSKANFFEWSSKDSQMNLPLLGVHIPDVDLDDDSSDKPFQLGPPMRSTYHVKLRLPENFSAHAPLPMTLRREYATYESSYKLENNTLTAERTFQLRWGEMPRERGQDFAAFRRAVMADSGQTIAMENQTAGTVADAGGSKAKADDLFEAATDALKNNKLELAINLLQRVVQMEPKHKYAWNALGQAYTAMQQYPDAESALKKQIEINPYDEYAYSSLGRLYWLERKYDDAAQAFRKQIEISPLDKFAHAYLASMLAEQEKFADALPELEKAVNLDPRNAVLMVSLGQAYLNTGQPEKAITTFDKAVEISPTPIVWNNIAYELSKKQMYLDRAQRYAESAIAATEAGLRNISLDRLSLTDLGLVSSIESYWDTLGWIYYQRGDLDTAEKYIRSAWDIGQHGEVGDHLGQILEKRGHKEEATHVYAMAAASNRPGLEARKHLAALVGDAQADKLIEKTRPELESLRTVRLAAKPKAAGTADFFLVFSPESKVDEVKFVRGDEQFKGFADLLRSQKFDVQFPDQQAKLVRRAALDCSMPAAVVAAQPKKGKGGVTKAGAKSPEAATDATCRLVLITPDAVRGID